MNPILPGSTIGVLGSGQLGRMFAIAARRMGYRVHTFSPDSDTPTGQVADVEVKASYDDLDAVRQFARGVNVVTFEFENVSAAAVDAASQMAPVRPSGQVLHTSQHRLREKTFLSNAGFPVTPFATIKGAADIGPALQKLGSPAVLKTAGFGYDGKGQAKIHTEEEGVAAFTTLGGAEAVLEGFINFETELSVIAARGVDGKISAFPAIQNIHRHHILDVSICPTLLPAEIGEQAIDIACSVLEAMDVVGILCVEFFLTRDGKLLINETAPRPHNSGHLTFDACVTSQFEQQLRAVCGLPLGATDLLRPAAMANILGDMWAEREPQWALAAAFPHVKIHLYGKVEARPGRKMGHLTALARQPEVARDTVLSARQALLLTVGASLK